MSTLQTANIKHESAAAAAISLDADGGVALPGALTSTEPAAPVEGQLWLDNSGGSVVAKTWDGSAWQSFSPGSAIISGTPTGTYSSAGVDYAYYEFTASGTATVTRAGFADVLVVGGGGGGTTNGSVSVGGGAGAVRFGSFYLDAAPVTVTIGAGGASGGGSTAGGNGSASEFGSFLKCGGGMGGVGRGGDGVSSSGFGGGGSPGGFGALTTVSARGGGAGGLVFGSNAYDGINLSYTGSSVTYGLASASGSGTANTGNGAGPGNNTGGSGIVIIRVRT